MTDAVTITVDIASLLTLAAGGKVHCPSANVVLVPGVDLARLQYRVKTRVNGGVKVQAAPPAKSIE